MLVCSISDGLSVACDLQVIDHHSRSQACQEKDGQHQLALEERRQKGSEYVLILKQMPCMTEWRLIAQELPTCQHSLDPATLLDHIMQESQELKKQHSAELQQAQREQAPLQAVCMVLRESKRKDFLPPSKQAGSLCCLKVGKLANLTRYS